MTSKVTIIVPALNESSHIENCLNSLHSQSYPRSRVEILVVDNGSTDNTIDLAKAAGARVLSEPRKSAYWARNLGIESSEGDWIAFTDADCIADPYWIENLLRCADATNATMVGGLIEYEMKTATLGNRILIETHGPDQLQRTIEVSHSVAGGNMFVRRDAFQQHGLFNVIAWGSDIEYSKRIAAEGGIVAFAPDAIVRHQCDLSNWEYLRRSYETRYGQVLLFDQRRGLGDALRNAARLPWKPGFFAGKHRYQSESIKPAGMFVDWMYRWAIRWMEFFGEEWAIVVKGRNASRPRRCIAAPSDAARLRDRCSPR